MCGNGRPGSKASGVRTGKAVCAKILVGDGQLLLVQRGIIQDLNAGFGQRRQQLIVQAFVRLGQQLLGLAADGHQLRSRMHPVGAYIQDSGVHLVDQAGHPHHEELVHVGADYGEKFDALQQRVAFVLRLLQNPELEMPAGSARG